MRTMPCSTIRSFNFLFLSDTVKLGNYKACVLHFERALDRANLLQDDSASEAIQKVNTDIPILLSHSLPHPSHHPPRLWPFL